MSDSKRATLITVGAPKSAKNNVTQTVRLTINLDESNESKYPELNYKELVIAEERKNKVDKLENGTQKGLDPFSDNDDDVERVARKFEQKYGGTSTYKRRKGKRKHDEFADIGAGYDENDSFIDNTDGYDEMIPPECDTLYGGFYINSGSLEFKNVPENQLPMSDEDIGNRRNKRRISSSSSEEQESSDSLSESSQDEKETKPVTNGDVSHQTEHRKKKNKKSDKKAKRIRRTDSSAATSGKQTSDDNVHGNDESVDSRTSHSDSLTSKPAPSSENVVTSDSSREATDSKLESSLPSPVRRVLEEMKCDIARLQLADPHIAFQEIDASAEPFLIRLESTLWSSSPHAQKCCWQRVARILNTTRSKLCARVKLLVARDVPVSAPAQANSISTSTSAVNNKRKQTQDDDEDYDIASMTELEKEKKIVAVLAKLHALIEEKKPGMISNYNAECNRVQEERKKIQLSGSDGKHIEKRLPKRRFPWCLRSRTLLGRVSRLAGSDAPAVLAYRVLPLFPKGFVRMPTLLRQADIKTSAESKRQRLTSASQPVTNVVQSFSEPILFPSSLTVTTMPTMPMDTDDGKDHKKLNNLTNSIESHLGTIVNSYSLNKELTIEKDDKIIEPEKQKADDKYLPPNSIGSITITPVNNAHKPEKSSKVISSVTISDKQKEPLIRVKTPATLIKEANELERKEKDKLKTKEKNHSLPKEKRIHSPLLIETNFQPKEKPKSSPSLKKEDLVPKKVESLRASEDKIPRPGLIPKQHSPTFAKPDKRPPDPKKKKDVGLVIVSDLDPLGDQDALEPLAIDDSSSDVEVIEEKSEVNKPKTQVIKNSDENTKKSDIVPLKDNSVIHTSVIHNQKDGSLMVRDKHKKEPKGDNDLDDTEADIDTVMRNLREMQDSQEPTYTSSSYGGVITSAKRMKAFKQRSSALLNTGLTSLSKMDGCSSSEVDVA